MSTLQDAIAKARATRAQAPAAQPSSHESQWEAVPAFKPSIRRLRRNRIVPLVGNPRW